MQTPAFKQKNFRNLSAEQRSHIASVGGRTAHELGRAHKWDSDAAREAGRKGAEARARNKAARLANAAPAQGVQS